MSVAATIEAKLRRHFSPIRLAVVDESHRHAGHSGARPGGETHFRVEIVAENFAGLSRVARQRAIYQILAEEMAGPVHALSVSVMTPTEAAATAPQN